MLSVLYCLNFPGWPNKITYVIINKDFHQRAGELGNIYNPIAIGRSAATLRLKRTQHYNIRENFLSLNEVAKVWRIDFWAYGV